ncbi:MAG: energy-coupling factor ABC transporter permease [Spirochaetales bacterium]|nr:energy-coupling factor ABC transporter permease [Spirochaetales bacterium]
MKRRNLVHIPDGLVSVPISIATAVVSTGVGAAAVARARRTLGEKNVPILGVSAAFVFAAQMLNFPVAAGTSGHFLGALMVALLLGPLNGFLVMAVVLVMQSLLFADGGLTALGTNIFNMGIVGGLGGYGLFRLLILVLPRRRGVFVAAAAVSAWFSVVLAASVCAVELALSGTSPLALALPAMAGVHVLIGVGEGIISAVVVSLMLGVRPDLVLAWRR